MYINEYRKKFRYNRTSKLGINHPYFRQKTIVVLRCDNCNSEFERSRGSMDPKRINNNCFHVCSSCDAKVFAQRKGIERKQVWNLPASSNLDISKL